MMTKRTINVSIVSIVIIILLSVVAYRLKKVVDNQEVIIDLIEKT